VNLTSHFLKIIYCYNVNGDSKSGELAHVFALGQNNIEVGCAIS